jgi:hypothetical protein
LLPGDPQKRCARRLENLNLGFLIVAPADLGAAVDVADFGDVVVNDPNVRRRLKQPDRYGKERVRDRAGADRVDREVLWQADITVPQGWEQRCQVDRHGRPR